MSFPSFWSFAALGTGRNACDPTRRAVSRGCGRRRIRPVGRLPHHIPISAQKLFHATPSPSEPKRAQADDSAFLPGRLAAPQRLRPCGSPACGTEVYGFSYRSYRSYSSYVPYPTSSNRRNPSRDSRKKSKPCSDAGNLPRCTRSTTCINLSEFSRRYPPACKYLCKCPNGFVLCNTFAFIFPLTHTAAVRCAIWQMASFCKNAPWPSNRFSQKQKISLKGGSRMRDGKVRFRTQFRPGALSPRPP
jgi:hypothetical protein